VSLYVYLYEVRIVERIVLDDSSQFNSHSTTKASLTLIHFFWRQVKVFSTMAFLASPQDRNLSEVMTDRFIAMSKTPVPVASADQPLSHLARDLLDVLSPMALAPAAGLDDIDRAYIGLPADFPFETALPNGFQGSDFVYHRADGDPKTPTFEELYQAKTMGIFKVTNINAQFDTIRMMFIGFIGQNQAQTPFFATIPGMVPGRRIVIRIPTGTMIWFFQNPSLEECKRLFDATTTLQETRGGENPCSKEERALLRLAKIQPAKTQALQRVYNEVTYAISYVHDDPSTAVLFAFPAAERDTATALALNHFVTPNTLDTSTIQRIVTENCRDPCKQYGKGNARHEFSPAEAISIISLTDLGTAKTDQFSVGTLGIVASKPRTDGIPQPHAQVQYSAEILRRNITELYQNLGFALIARLLEHLFKDIYAKTATFATVLTSVPNVAKIIDDALSKTPPTLRAFDTMPATIKPHLTREEYLQREVFTLDTSSEEFQKLKTVQDTNVETRLDELQQTITFMQQQAQTQAGNTKTNKNTHSQDATPSTLTLTGGLPTARPNLKRGKNSNTTHGPPNKRNATTTDEPRSYLGFPINKAGIPILQEEVCNNWWRHLGTCTDTPNGDSSVCRNKTQHRNHQFHRNDSPELIAAYKAKISEMAPIHTTTARFST
jgi:hypothetical protein